MIGLGIGFGLSSQRVPASPSLPDAPDAPGAVLDGLNTVDLSVSLPSGATGVIFYGTSDAGDTYESGEDADGSLNTGVLAPGVWTFTASGVNAAGTGPQGPASSPVTRILPNANVTSFLTFGPAWCFQERNATTTASGNGDLVGTIVDRATGRWWVAPADNARGTLVLEAGKYHIATDGSNDRYISNDTLNFGNGPFTVTLGLTPTSNATGSNKDMIGSSTGSNLTLGIRDNGNASLIRQLEVGVQINTGLIANNACNTLSFWSTLGAQGLGSNTTVSARVNGGANASASLANITPTACTTLFGSQHSAIGGKFYGLIYANANLASGSGLATVELVIQGQMPS